MFTGLITEVGTVKKLERSGDSAKLTVACPKTALNAADGDSIAVNGCCLTVTGIIDENITFDVMPETVERTNLKKLIGGDRVNLEPALRVGEELGGHFVTGHIDGVGYVSNIVQRSGAKEVEVAMAGPLLKFVVSKGSVALDGISLTVIDVSRTALTVGIIPFTQESTTVSSWRPGTLVNVETDIIGKYVEKMVNKQESILEEIIGSEEWRQHGI